MVARETRMLSIKNPAKIREKNLICETARKTMTMEVKRTTKTEIPTTTMNTARLLVQLLFWMSVATLSSNAFRMPIRTPAARSKKITTTAVSIWKQSDASSDRISTGIFNYNNNKANRNNSRREWFQKIGAGTIGMTLAATIQPTIVQAASSVVAVPATEEMKTFLDPDGLFAVNIPQRFFAIRRKADPRRRESMIFTAGDLAKAELIAIERFPTRLLLEENGIAATGNLSTIADIGTPAAVATLIAAHRDATASVSSRGSTTQVDPESIRVSQDGREISFDLSTRIDVQKPELLLEQYGVSELYRITSVKATILPPENDPYMMAIFGSALQQDWSGPDGTAIRASVQSLQSL